MVGDNRMRREAIVPLERAGEMGFGGGGGDVHIHLGNGLIMGSAAEVVRMLETAVEGMRRSGQAPRLQVAP